MSELQKSLQVGIVQHGDSFNPHFTAGDTFHSDLLQLTHSACASSRSGAQLQDPIHTHAHAHIPTLSTSQPPPLPTSIPSISLSSPGSVAELGELVVLVVPVVLIAAYMG